MSKKIRENDIKYEKKLAEIQINHQKELRK